MCVYVCGICMYINICICTVYIVCACVLEQMYIVFVTKQLDKYYFMLPGSNLIEQYGVIVQ